MSSENVNQLVRYVHECMAFIKTSKHHSTKNKQLFNAIMFIDKRLHISRSKPTHVTTLTNQSFQHKCKCIILISIAYVKKKLQQKHELLERYLLENKLKEFIDDDSALMFAKLLKDIQTKTKMIL